MAIEEGCTDLEGSERDVPAYLRAISEALLTQHAGYGWGWRQSRAPEDQTVVSMAIDGTSVAALIESTNCGPSRMSHVDVSIAFEGSDGCSAHHVVFDPDGGKYCAASIDYGWEAHSVAFVVWHYNPRAKVATVERYVRNGQTVSPAATHREGDGHAAPKDCSAAEEGRR